MKCIMEIIALNTLKVVKICLYLRPKNMNVSCFMLAIETGGSNCVYYLSTLYSEEGVQNSNYAVQNRSQRFNRNSNLNNPHSMLYAHISNQEAMHSMQSTVLHLLKKITPN